ncbi:MAG: HD-GYP domain-containing protein [Lachnospiraceae bacterium]|nr:HD-GYP domain-containing protein [Lachnospiraceae bacterium]
MGNGNNVAAIKFALISTGIQLALQILFMFLYIKLFKALNPSIAMFMYLCSIMLVPPIFYIINTWEVGGKVLIPLYLALHIMFYLFAVRTIAEICKKKLETNKGLFIAMPAFNFIFNTVIYILFMYSFYVGYIGQDFVNKIISLKDVESSLIKNGKDVMHILTRIVKYLDFVIVIPTIFTTAVVIVCFSVIAKNIRYMNETIEAKDAIKELSVEVMEALAHTIDAKDEYTKGHSIRVANYSKMIAEKMGLNEEQCENIYYMGLLHDLGKIGVPNEIINKPDKLTEEEYEIIKKHPGTGYNILSEMKSRPDLAIGAHWHHERYDGTGYPDHKKGEEIPLEARIIAVADCYDAMTSNRSYRNYLDQERVKAELRSVSGTQLDSKAVEAMLGIIEADKDYIMHE